jgi:hypothetical protein
LAVTFETVGGVASYLSAMVAVPTLPAPSVQEPLTVALGSSGPVKSTEEQPAIPAVASVPENVTVSAWLYQPLASEALLAVAFAVGGVESYLSARLAVAMLPARSVQEPVRVALALSGALYSGDEQPAMPAVASAPEIFAVSGWLYQPFVSAPRLATAVAVGGVTSYLKGKLVVPTLPALSVQKPTTVTPTLSGPL